MGIKPGVASQKGKELSEVPQETTTNSSASSRRNRRRNRKASLVQTLYHTCKEVFATGGNGFIPPPNDVERLRSILGMMLFNWNHYFQFAVFSHSSFLDVKFVEI